MQIERFQVLIDEEGEMIFNSPSHKHLFKKFLQQFSGKKVSVEVQERKSTRSQQQNSYYWVYLGVIATESGHSTEDLHELFKGKFLSSGIKEIFGEKVRSKQSTTQLSVGRFVEYLMEIEELTGVPLPDTTEYYGFSYHKY